MPKDFHTCLKLSWQVLWNPTRGSAMPYVSIAVVEFLLLFLKKQRKGEFIRMESYRKELHDGTMAFCQEI